MTALYCFTILDNWGSDELMHIGTRKMETDRLLLRKYEVIDAEDMFRNWLTDPEVSKFWGWKPHENLKETQLLLQGWISDYAKMDYYHWVIVVKELSEAVGYIYLNEINCDEKSACIHYLISRRYWNQGIMTEACKAVLAYSFNKIGICKIHTHHHIDNPASGKVMQKSGMRYVETRHKRIAESPQISGDYCFYEITSEEWKQAN